MQKILMLFSSEDELMQQATNISIRELPTQQKVMMFIFYGVIAIAFSIVVYFIIRKLKDINERRGTFRDEKNYKTMTFDKKDPVFNISFFAIIILYIVFMFLPSILMFIL